MHKIPICFTRSSLCLSHFVFVFVFVFVFAFVFVFVFLFVFVFCVCSKRSPCLQSGPLACDAPEANGPPLPYLMGTTDVGYRIRNNLN